MVALAPPAGEPTLMPLPEDGSTHTTYKEGGPLKLSSVRGYSYDPVIVRRLYLAE
jgi:hypothetical protein